MPVSTKHALAAALKKMMETKPLDKITVKDLVELCGVNRQTFYYHFDDVYDLLNWIFEEDASRTLPKTIVYEAWKQNVIQWFDYLCDNFSFFLNVYNSNSRMYMMHYLYKCVKTCIGGFADIVSRGINIDRQDYDFVIDFYTNGILGLISQWLNNGMLQKENFDMERFIRILDNSVENMIEKFQAN